MTEKVNKKITTPIFMISFPKLIKGEISDKTGKLEYPMVMAFDKSDPAVAEGLQRMVELANATGLEKFGSQWAFVSANRSKPLFKSEKNMAIDVVKRPEWKGMVVVNTKSDQPPGIVIGPNREPLVNPSDLRAGDFCIATVNAYAFDQPTNRGVSFGLHNVWKIRTGTPLGTRQSAEDDFESVSVDMSDFNDDTPTEAAASGSGYNF